MRGRMENGVNRVVKSECGGGGRCVNAGGPYRSESAGSSSTEQQMRTDYSAVKNHMKGNAGNGQTDFSGGLKRPTFTQATSCGRVNVFM